MHEIDVTNHLDGSLGVSLKYNMEKKNLKEREKQYKKMFFFYECEAWQTVRSLFS